MTRSFVTQFGPNHFKVIKGRDLGVHVEPRRLYGLVWPVVGITSAFTVAVCLATSVPLEGKIAMSVLGSAAAVTLAAFFVFLDRYEQALGPYLAVDRDGVHLRHGLQVPLEEFAGFGVTLRWEAAHDGETLVGYLVLRTKGGEEVEILRSVCPSEVSRLKEELDETMSRILAVKTGSERFGK